MTQEQYDAIPLNPSLKGALEIIIKNNETQEEDE
jgi:hypothetical protein